MAKSITRKQIKEAAADELGLFIPVTVGNINATAKTVVVDGLTDLAPNPEYLQNAFLTEDGNTFRRVISFDGTKLTLTDNLAGLSDGDPASLYFLLNPQDWNRMLDRQLTSELYVTSRQVIPLIAGTREYAVTGNIQTRADIQNLLLRDTSTAIAPIEESVPAAQFLETANGLTIHLVYTPEAVTNVDLIVVYKDFYTALASDSTTTTCPYGLAWRALEVAALRKMFNKFGPKMKDQFAGAFGEAMRQLDRHKAKHMPPLKARDYMPDYAFVPDITSEILDGGAW